MNARITYLMIINPLLIPLATMTRIEDDIGAAVIQARLVSTDLASLAQHPVLWQTIKINVRGFWPPSFAYDRWFWQLLHIHMDAFVHRQTAEIINIQETNGIGKFLCNLLKKRHKTRWTFLIKVYFYCRSSSYKKSKSV